MSIDTIRRKMFASVSVSVQMSAYQIDNYACDVKG